MTVSVEQFRTAVVAAGLLTHDELEAHCRALPATAADGESFAKSLVAKQTLTEFQVDEILSGRRTPLVLGDYVLLDKLGAGGMGQVYKARHRHMKRLVALKLMLPEYVKDEASVKRFRREVEAAARLEHPNIVTAHDSRVDAGVHYLVMQFVDGADLQSLVSKQGRIPVDQAVNYVLQTARGLAYAHGQGVVHRDIKPANLLLDKSGVVKILDVGLARLDGGQSVEGLTGAAQVMGTVDYMSPEQSADAHEADGRSDIYSLGCTLWYLLTAQPMYVGDTMVKRIMKHREAPIPSLAQRREEVTWPLEQIHRKMVAKRPEDRYATMDEVVAALEKLAAADSKTGRREAVVDEKLGAFFKDLNAGGKSSRGTTTQPEPLPTMGDSPSMAPLPTIAPPPADGSPTADVDEQYKTIAASAAKVETESVPATAAPMAAPKTPLAGSLATSSHRRAQPPKSPSQRNKFIAVGLAAAAIFAGVIIIIRNQQGKEVGKLELPAGHTATVIDPSLKSEISNPESSAPPLAVAPFDAAQAKAHQEAWAKHLGTTVETVNSVGAKMILIPPGEFMMGSSDEEVQAAVITADVSGTDPGTKQRIARAERPQHRVVLTKPFLLGNTEVTVGQFRQFVDATHYATDAEKYGFGDSAGTVVDDKVTEMQKQRNWRTPGFDMTGKTHERPVTQITWNDAAAFCDWLSAREKTKYRLPTEAEWEYACRAGTTTKYSFGDDNGQVGQFAWYTANSDNQTQPVGTKSANAFGLYDMHGNLYEWCQDYYDEEWYGKSPTSDPRGPISGEKRIMRGGYWNVPPLSLRSAARNHAEPTYRNYSRGFRVVRVLDATVQELPGTPVRLTPSQPTPTAGTIPASTVGSALPDTIPLVGIAPFDAAQARAHQAAWAKHLGIEVDTTNSVGAKMILIPPGEFLMGSSPSEIESLLLAEANPIGRAVIEGQGPQHRVHLLQPFYVGTTEVTQAQYQAVLHTNPSAHAARGPRGFAVVGQDTAEFPVDSVSWFDAIDFCNRLSMNENRAAYYRIEGEEVTILGGEGYRLPTEAEWEFACRAGTEGAFWTDGDLEQLDRAAWLGMNSETNPHTVGSKLANPFGLFDMHGNVWEWCVDWFGIYGDQVVTNPMGPLRPSQTLSGRVMRGGAYNSAPQLARSAWRFVNSPENRMIYAGFRIVRSAVPVGVDKTTSVPSFNAPPPAAPPIAAHPRIAAPQIATAPFDAAQARAHQEAWAKHLGIEVETTNSVGAKMVLIPPGEFMMGSTDAEVEAVLKAAQADDIDVTTSNSIQNDERPQHRVVISKPFLAGSTEVTVGQFRQFVNAAKYSTEAERYGFGNSGETELSDKVLESNKGQHWLNPGYDFTDDSPVTQVTWSDAVAFCEWLSEKEQATYRLPTEAEREYMARAGTTTQFSYGDDERQLSEHAWLKTNAGGRAHPVAAKRSNPFGLYDVHGNVSEWCGDFYSEHWYKTSPTNDPNGPTSGANRVVRDGSWYRTAYECRSASRFSGGPTWRKSHLGFRVVREVKPAAPVRSTPSQPTPPAGTIPTPTVASPPSAAASASSPTATPKPAASK